MKEVFLLLRIVDFSSRAIVTAARNPSTYRPNIVTAGSDRKLPSTGIFGTNAAMISV
jgi:hypothetical protein